ncbi:MAG: plasmid mobilization protein, partial [Candidatus Cryptobacteroides sp.]
MGAEKRRHKVTVTLNDQEYDQVSLKAGLTPFTISEYCRKAALRHQVR